MNGRQHWHDNLMTETENYAMMSENILMFLRPPPPRLHSHDFKTRLCQGQGSHRPFEYSEVSFYPGSDII